MLKLRLFKRPDYLDGLANAEAEARFGRLNTSAMKAMHAGMVFFWVVSSGIILLALKIPGMENLIQATNLVSLWETVGNPLESWRAGLEWAGIALGVLLAFKFFQLISEHFVRFAVGLLSLSVSVREGMAFRRYVFKPGARLFFITLGTGAVAIWTVLSFFGIRGWLAFVMPRFAFSLPWELVLAILLASVGAFLLFPAMSSKTHDRDELLAMVMETNFIQATQLRDKLVKDTVRIAAPHLSQQLLAEIQSKGVDALSDWLSVPPSKWQRLRKGLHQLGVDPSYVQRVSYGRDGQRHLLGIEDRGGKVTIADAERIAVDS